MDFLGFIGEWWEGLKNRFDKSLASAGVSLSRGRRASFGSERWNVARGHSNPLATKRYASKKLRARARAFHEGRR